jgi:molybdopterin-guanine dinucleotide biosynthesis protein A
MPIDTVEKSAGFITSRIVMESRINTCSCECGQEDSRILSRATAIVLAGGLSSRMGRDKAMLEIDGTTLIERIVRQLKPLFSEILISARGPNDYAFLGLRVVPDKSPGQGPLMAIASALEASSNDLNFVVSCDIPDLPEDLIATLLREAINGDGAVPVRERWFYEPLFAAYRKSMVTAANQALARGQRRVVDMYQNRAIREIHLESDWEIKNLNTADDFRHYRIANSP